MGDLFSQRKLFFFNPSISLHKLCTRIAFYLYIRPEMKKIKYILCVLLALLCLPQTQAQEIDALPEVKESEVAATAMEVQVGRILYGGDSITHVVMPDFYKYPELTFKNDKERQRYNRLVQNVKKLLPLAKLAKLTVIETYEYIETLPTKEARAAHLDLMEKELTKTYTPTLKKMSRSQGKLFVKLIDRECNQTGYDIAKAFIGSFKANAYQALAWLFGQSLTKRYDPEGDDYFTERVVRMVESGQL